VQPGTAELKRDLFSRVFPTVGSKWIPQTLKKPPRLETKQIVLPSRDHRGSSQCLLPVICVHGPPDVGKSALQHPAVLQRDGMMYSSDDLLLMNSSPRIALTRDCDSIEIPSGARKSLPCATSVRIMLSRGGSYTVTTDLAGMYRIDASDADVLGLSRRCSPGRSPDRANGEQPTETGIRSRNPRKYCGSWARLL
jgi:hypothetical protein